MECSWASYEKQITNYANWRGKHCLFVVYSGPQIIYEIKIEVEIATSNLRWLTHLEFGQATLIKKKWFTGEFYLKEWQNLVLVVIERGKSCFNFQSLLLCIQAKLGDLSILLSQSVERMALWFKGGSCGTGRKGERRN